MAEDYPDHTYLSSYKFVPYQDAELERRIMENHKKHTYVVLGYTFPIVSSHDVRVAIFGRPVA